MRDYEIVYIFRSNLSTEEVEAKLERYHGIITEGSGEITAVVQWGKRQLAYPIQKQPNGHYVVAQFTSPPDPLTELERVLKLEDDVLRYLVVISEGEMPLPEALPQADAPAEAPAEAPAAEAASEEAEEKGDAEEADEAEASDDGEEAEAADDGEAADEDAGEAADDEGEDAEDSGDADAETEDADDADEKEE